MLTTETSAECTSKRNPNLRMAKALYDYSTTREHATWNNKRPGLSIPATPGIRWKSCGGFRTWSIHAHDGTVAFSMDGFAHRNRECGGSVMVLVGDGQIVFPTDNARVDHSQRLSTTDSAKLVSVNSEVDWQPAINRMADVLENALAELQGNTSAYDKQKESEANRQRDNDLAAARATVGQAEGSEALKR